MCESGASLSDNIVISARCSIWDNTTSQNAQATRSHTDNIRFFVVCILAHCICMCYLMQLFFFIVFYT